MKVHYFSARIQGSTDTHQTLLTRIDKLTLIDREKPVLDRVMFLEHLEANQDFYDIDFTQRRLLHGPGHSQQGQPTVDFTLGQGGGFGEQTAVVWSKTGHHVAIQYNHYGPRAGNIAYYLSSFLTRSGNQQLPQLIFTPVVDDDVMAKLESSTVQATLECAIDGAMLSDSMADHNVAVSSMLDLTNATAAGRLEIKLSHGSGKRSGPLEIMSTIQNLLELGPKKLKVSIKADFDSKMEVLDLLEHRQVEEIPEENLRLTDGLRWKWHDRVNGIRGKFGPWLSQQQS